MLFHCGNYEKVYSHILTDPSASKFLCLVSFFFIASSADVTHLLATDELLVLNGKAEFGLLGSVEDEGRPLSSSIV